MKVAVVVRKRELEGLDNASIPPISGKEFAISARLLAGSVKPGGGAMDVVSGGGLRLGGGTELGRLLYVEAARFIFWPRRMRFVQSRSPIFM